MRAGVHRDVRAGAAAPRGEPSGSCQPRRGARAVVGVGVDALLQQRAKRRRAGRNGGAHGVRVDAVDMNWTTTGLATLGIAPCCAVSAGATTSRVSAMKMEMGFMRALYTKPAWRWLESLNRRSEDQKIWFSLLIF